MYICTANDKTDSAMKRSLLFSVMLIMCLLTAAANMHFYRGNSHYSSDILYAWDGRYLYRGRSSYSSDIIYSWDGKCLYQGRSNYSSDIIISIAGGHIYRGRSNYSSDILYSYTGIIPIPALIFMMM